MLEDKRLVEGGFVYLFEEGKRRTKRMDELCPLDAPAVLAEMERTAPVSVNYIRSAARSTPSSMAGVSW